MMDEGGNHETKQELNETAIVRVELNKELFCWKTKPYWRDEKCCKKI